MHDRYRDVSLAIGAAASVSTLAIGAALWYPSRPATESCMLRMLPLPPTSETKLNDHKNHTAFIFGLGLTGIRVARQLLIRGWKVYGTVRSRGAASKISQEGIEVFVFDSTAADSDNDIHGIEAALAATSHVLITSAPVIQGDPVLACAPFAEVFSLATPNAITWVGYLSTVGVYGNRNGQEVNEESDVKPSSERGKRRVAAETAWSTTGLPVCVFRLPGIYGPNRGPIAKVRGGTARRVTKEGQIFSRIHVDDIVRVVLCSAASPRKGAIYNVVDDEPTAGHVVVTHACQLLNVAPPPLIPFEEAGLSAMAKSFYSECRYIKNTLIKREFDLELLYPTFREGQQAQLEEEREEALRSISHPRQSVITNIISTFSSIFDFTNVLLFTKTSRRRRCVHVVLVDNGSLRAASTLNLRQVAKNLEQDVRFKFDSVSPTSARWSSKVDAANLEGRPAELLLDCLRRLGRSSGDEGCDVVLLPFFLGPSETVTEFCPQQSRTAMNEFPTVVVKISPPLFCACPYLNRLLPPQQRKLGADDRIARLLSNKLMHVMNKHSINNPAILVCDHGTPTQSVNQVRQAIAAQVAGILEGKVSAVHACSMERRPGSEYDFNKPLLEDAIPIAQATSTSNVVIVALLFLSPGKHAGAGGDIACIIKLAQASAADLTVRVTDVIGDDPIITDVLLDRLHQTVAL